MLKAISKFIYKNIPVKFRWAITCVSAFAGFILLINTESALADKQGLGGLFTILGIALILITVAFVAVAVDESNQQSTRRR